MIQRPTGIIPEVVFAISPSADHGSTFHFNNSLSHRCNLNISMPGFVATDLTEG